jgi:U2 small nuclear ribonucleoprotein A'
MINNPITTNKNYRLYVIHRLPHLKVLDFQKVKHTERALAKETFGEFSMPNQKEQLAKMSKNEKLKMAIEKASTMEEINRLEFLLKSGELSESILDQKLIEYKIF